MLFRSPNLVSLRKSAYEGIDLLEDGVPFDRVVLDLPEPWQVVPHAAKALRSGGIYLSFVPTVPQVVQTVEALERAKVFGMVETFESLIRTWSVLGRSVRPDHRMVAHSGFITVARKVEPGLLGVRSESDSAEAAFSDSPDAIGMEEATS